jgi:predicted AlkP superfamily pyrophosphatase or phosphodiesterase
MKRLASSRLLRNTFAVLAVALGLLLLRQGCAKPPGEAQATTEAAPVLLIGIDGFRYDYLRRFDLPTLERLAEGGTFAPEGMRTVFPTKTFPNHYTLVTGLYPAQHGIVSNTMRDPELEDGANRFSLGNRDAIEDARWWGGEPIWSTAERQGVRAATYFWPGSEAEIAGYRPSFWKRYDGSIPGEQRVDEVLAWLDLPEEARPGFLTLYFSKVDGAGHDDGPDAPSVEQAARKVDGYLARLVEGLEARGLADAVNLVVVSDHGMAATSPERVIAVDDCVPQDALDIVDRSPVLMANPAEGYDAGTLVADLAACSDRWRVWRTGEGPEHLRFEGSARIPEIVALADEGWSIATSRAYLESNPGRFEGGAHGYDPALESMKALFIAHGPAFRAGTTIPVVENVHVYPLLAELLGVDPAENEGDLGVWTGVLRMDD